MISFNATYPQVDVKTAFQLVMYNPSVYKLVVQYGWGGNILVIRGKNALTLVDTGYKNTLQALAYVLQTKFKAKVDQIINTHYHSDHAGGNAIIDPIGSIILHKNAFKEWLKRKNCIYVDVATSINCGNETIEIIPKPYGHSDTDMLIFLKSSNILCVGDLYLADSYPLVSSGNNNSAFTLLENLKHILKISNQETVIVGGHGNDTSKALLRKYILMVEQTINIVVNAIEKGWSKSEIQRKQVLKKWDTYNGSISFITANSWIENIYRSYTSPNFQYKKLSNG